MDSELQEYEKYVSAVTEKLNKFFNDQKDYIFCHEGCALCCKNAEFPFTNIEFRYLLEGLSRLDEDIKLKIFNNIMPILEHKSNDKSGKKLLYDCPMLIDNKCAVYSHRGLVCRSFGLLSLKKDQDNRAEIPFCALQGLNYSNVLDKETSTISEKKFLASGIETYPKVYDINYFTSLTKKEPNTDYGFDFGEIKPLIVWLEEELIKNLKK